MNRVAWINGNTVTVTEVDSSAIYSPEMQCENAYGVSTVAVEGDMIDYRVINVMETAFLDWSTVDYICTETL